MRRRKTGSGDDGFARGDQKMRGTFLRSCLAQIGVFVLVIVLFNVSAGAAPAVTNILDPVIACVLGGLLAYAVIHAFLMALHLWQKRHPPRRIQGVGFNTPDPARTHPDGTAVAFKEWSGMHPALAACWMVCLWGLLWVSNRAQGWVSSAAEALIFGTVGLFIASLIWRGWRAHTLQRRELLNRYGADPSATKASLPPVIPLAAVTSRARSGALAAPPGVGESTEPMSDARAQRAWIVELAQTGVGARFALDQVPYEMDVVPLGTLQVSDGVIGAGDPFQQRLDPFRFAVGPGSYPTHLATLRRLDMPHAPEQNAFVTVRIAQGRRAATQALLNPDGSPLVSESGCIGFFDMTALTAATGQELGVADLLDRGSAHGWWALMHDVDAVHPLRDNTVRRADTLNMRLPWATHDENVIMVPAHSNRQYTCLFSEDPRGRVLEVTVDLGVIDIWG